MYDSLWLLSCKWRLPPATSSDSLEAHSSVVAYHGFEFLPRKLKMTYAVWGRAEFRIQTSGAFYSSFADLRGENLQLIIMEKVHSRSRKQTFGGGHLVALQPSAFDEVVEGFILTIRFICHRYRNTYIVLHFVILLVTPGSINIGKWLHVLPSLLPIHPTF